ncbi:hypothetical protein ACFWGG_32280, partial [Streptomyces roseolus]
MTENHDRNHDGKPQGSVPSRQRKRFPGISSRAYEHPADRSALVALRKLSGFDTVFKALSGLLPERSLRLHRTRRRRSHPHRRCPPPGRGRVPDRPPRRGH